MAAAWKNRTYEVSFDCGAGSVENSHHPSTEGTSSHFTALASVLARWIQAQALVRVVAKGINSWQQTRWLAKVLARPSAGPPVAPVAPADGWADFDEEIQTYPLPYQRTHWSRGVATTEPSKGFGHLPHCRQTVSRAVRVQIIAPCPPPASAGA
ncbi:hypothetical protein Aple_059590 [Acrocarpospora pleiomorpha]|uniref:Uncharacterized protein n=1 Tax=Acrocarpospora pleiomorpha TaxID=90975 RepID=A0A5M3XQE4_9ACTN|nr:hypothetical protein Aple_059590 [Acrocarpospora pleiomorpha]